MNWAVFFWGLDGSVSNEDCLKKKEMAHWNIWKIERFKAEQFVGIWFRMMGVVCFLAGVGMAWEVLPEMRKIRPFIGAGFTLLNSPSVGAIGAFRSTLVNLKIHWTFTEPTWVPTSGNEDPPKRPYEHISNEKRVPGCLGYIGDYSAQLHV